MLYKKLLLIPLTLLSLSTFSLATVYSDGEDGTVDAWSVYDNSPEGATISNVSDETRTSQVIEFKGKGRLNAYLLGKKDWNNRSEHYLKWSMNFSEKFKITLYLKTAHGYRVIYYDYKSYDKGFYHKKYIKIGLGSRSMSGTWQSFTRDVEADLKQYDPSNSLIAIKGLKVQGSGRIDDVRLEKEGESVTPPPSAFITTWKITNNHIRGEAEDSSSVTYFYNDKELRIATNGSYEYNFTIDWGDGKKDIDVKKTIVHKYNKEGTYTVSITGLYPKPEKLCIEKDYIYHKPSEPYYIYDYKEGMQDLISIVQWGNQEWKSMNKAFLYCENLKSMDSKAPNLSQVTDTNSMFRNTYRFNQPVNHWNLSTVTDMGYMFNSDPYKHSLYSQNYEVPETYGDFNQPLDEWNVSKVKNMEGMLNDTALSVENYDNILKAWSQLPLQKNVVFGKQIFSTYKQLKYSKAGEPFRQKLIDDFGWEIKGDALFVP